MIGTAIRGILTAGMTVSVFPVIAPQTTVVPFVLYRIVSKNPEETKGNTGSLIITGLEVTTISRDYDEMEDTVEQVQTLLDGYSGTQSGVNIQEILYETEDDSYYEDYQAYARTQLYEISYNKI